MFNKESKQKPNTMERNVLAKNTRLNGDITSDGDFRIDGYLEGSLTTSGKVIIGTSGTISGKVSAANADVEGSFNGEMKLSETLTIKASASISGEVVTNKLSVEPGATFNATCSMGGAVKELNKHEQTTQREETA